MIDMADVWLAISSAEYDSHNGDSLDHTVEEALDGTDYWRGPAADTPCWLILDLGEAYTIKKVRGRSNTSGDPIDVDIYVSDSKVNWGAAVASGINTWQDTANWVEIDTTDKDGQYIKIDIIDYENKQWVAMGFGSSVPIFDAYGSVVAAPPAVPRPTVAVGNPLIF